MLLMPCPKVCKGVSAHQVAARTIMLAVASILAAGQWWRGVRGFCPVHYMLHGEAYSSTRIFVRWLWAALRDIVPRMTQKKIVGVCMDPCN